MTVLIFLATLLVLVAIHELGHFLVARAAGVHVHEFAIGIGPRLLSTVRRGTRYSLRLLPIGGYVLMAGEDRRESGDALRSDEILYNKPPYVRAAISLAGAVANIALAFVVTLVVVWSSNLPMLQVADVIPNTPAAAVFEPGDRVVAIDGRSAFTLDQITRAIRDSHGAPIGVDVLRDGAPMHLTVTPRFADADGRYEVGAYFLSVAPTNEVATISETSPLFGIGVRAGDRIVAVDETPVSTAVALLVALDDAFAVSDRAVLLVARGDETFAAEVAGGGLTSDDVIAGVEFADLGVDVRRPGFGNGLSLAARQFASYVTLLGQTVRGLIVGTIAPQDALQGPVGIAGVIRQGLRLGPLVFFQILAFLSLNFGLINLVPFPALDGSRAAFAVYEWIRGRPIPPEREGVIHAIGFAILIGLMILITYQDIVRLFR